jgi:hypothetical protein
MKGRNRAGLATLASTLVLIGAVAVSTGAAVSASASAAVHRYMVTVSGSVSYQQVRSDALRAGNRVVLEMPQIRTFVVVGGASAATSLAGPGVRVGLDGVKRITPADSTSVLPQGVHRQMVHLDAPSGGAQKDGFEPDPAFRYKGLQWDMGRIRADVEWEKNLGDPAVTVGVADTGLDFTQKDLKPNIVDVVDFTQSEDPPICSPTDAKLAKKFGGPETTDWNGHGSWIGGNIGAALDGRGINGIAPKVSLIALKISGNCGSAYDSTTLDAYLYAADHGIDIVSNSFGGYNDLSDPDQKLVYDNYVAAVKYARANGTTIVASAGNEHLRVGAGGRVLSHGPLTAPGTAASDLFGWYELPGGAPGVVDVSATNNMVVPARDVCPPGSIGDPSNTNATCKPTSDPHQALGQGLRDQLSYYSSYGPRIDVAAPGGARKFNLPVWDRGGTPGFPYTTDALTKVWEDFSTTSNWAQSIPCFTFQVGSGFPPGQCYSTIQGTSMAVPHVSATLALIASANPSLRHDVDALIAKLKAHAVRGHNHTAAIDTSDNSGGDLTGGTCHTGFCHLGTDVISNADAYGAGIIRATAAG